MTPALPSRAAMVRAFLRSDTSFDGIFFTAVRTTGIFCRPSCPARKPRPDRVDFYATPREALFAGYRPCRRCDPLRLPGERPAWVRRVLEAVSTDVERRLRDASLRRLGVDPARARRYFLRNYGMTFQAYSRGLRLGRALHEIREGASLDDAALGHGYESHSGFREAFAKAFGGPPGRGREARAVTVTWIETPLGPMVAAAVDEGVCLLEFTDRRMLEAQMVRLRRRLAAHVAPGDHPHLRALRAELDGYFAGRLRRFEVPLVFPGAAFEERVWRALLEIPYGQTRSYAALAEQLGSPEAQRAVGRANGMNRIAIVIPCHRVVNKNGQLGGYGGGLWRKQWLLDLEGGARPLFPGLGGD
ncbi:MAG TPA: methylated-DNA--[protein]-cysteine S-methyltransferase [Vicinamibacteria bacterium]|nr:methylated-DNA--[protein]-cysteine S-methyltransferase [Vicinamibacteria bacterium]